MHLIMELVLLTGGAPCRFASSTPCTSATGCARSCREFPIEIGDIGTIASDGSWRPITTVRQRFFSIPGRVHKARDARLVWEACSGDDVSFTAYARGEKSELVPKWVDAKPRAEVEFGSEASFLFAARRITVRTALETEDIIEKIRLAYHHRRQRPEEGRWYRDFSFVFAVGDAQRFTAIVPMRAPAKVAFMSRGPVGPPSDPAKIAGGVEMGAAIGEWHGINKENAQGASPAPTGCAPPCSSAGARNRSRSRTAPSSSNGPCRRSTRRSTRSERVRLDSRPAHAIASLPMAIDQEIARAQRTMWATGDYGDIAQTIESVAQEVVEAAGVIAGETLLDVATGTGNAALAAGLQAADPVGRGGGGARAVRRRGRGPLRAAPRGRLRARRVAGRMDRLHRARARPDDPGEARARWTGPLGGGAGRPARPLRAAQRGE
jgi:hypothetical protein